MQNDMILATYLTADMRNFSHEKPLQEAVKLWVSSQTQVSTTTRQASGNDSKRRGLGFDGGGFVGQDVLVEP